MINNLAFQYYFITNLTKQGHISRKTHSSVYIRFKIFVVVFRARKLFRTFTKRAPRLQEGRLNCHSMLSYYVMPITSLLDGTLVL